MKVYWQYQPNDTGKGQFTKRLLPALRNIGVDVRFEPKGCDATVSYVYFRDPRCSLPSLLRVDGIHMIKDHVHRGREKILADAIYWADGVIWQSEFCRRVVGNGFVGVHRNPGRNFVIWNGDNPGRFDGVSPIISPWARNIVIAAKWFDEPDQPRLWKRLRDHVKIAYEYAHQDPEACVWILGDCERPAFTNPQVRYMGWVNHEVLDRYLKMADVFLYAAWFDWCPNVVVEAMAAGCHVICSPNGGHAEIVQGFGTVVGGEEPVQPKDIRLRQIPSANVGDYISAIRAAPRRDQTPSRMNPDATIERVAEKYKAAIKAILR